MSNLKVRPDTMEASASFRYPMTMIKAFRLLRRLKEAAQMVENFVLILLAEFNWPVRLPANLPSCDRCTFAWSWINAVGNRELYSKFIH